MTAKPPILVPADTIDSLLSMLVEAKGFTPLRHDAIALIRDLTDALEHAESPTNHEGIVRELLEAIALATKTDLPNEPTLHSLKRAREALAGVSVDAQVIALPRATTPDVHRDIAAEVSRQLEQAHGVDVQICRRGSRSVMARFHECPRKGEAVIVGSLRLIVDEIEHHEDEDRVTAWCSEYRPSDDIYPGIG